MGGNVGVAGVHLRILGRHHGGRNLGGLQEGADETMSFEGKPSRQGSFTQPLMPVLVAVSARCIRFSGSETSGTSIQTTSSPGTSSFTVQFGV